ncbi:type 1 fimbria pilin [Luteibacter sp. Sphag1AF]|uniref:fimbrial protein n=1 Tax=Luteibacter sp. Sphag1AF TaxID=2587031 RepID=UPI001619BCF6|nr:fimbrial protein [Luteibacter sp. Sphag1AF]MBB3226977.1 type 1 fimbria pilin [Luteibacter sp. Sphag1AF]
MTIHIVMIRRHVSRHRALSCVMGLAALGTPVVPSQAHNSTTITVRGAIEQGTCELSVGSRDKKVELKAITLADLPASGVIPAGGDFQLQVINCSPGLVDATFTFTGRGDPIDPLRWLNTGTARGVAVELTDAKGATIDANGKNNARTVAVTAGQATIDLIAAYWRVSGTAARSGSVLAEATVEMSYE